MVGNLVKKESPPRPIEIFPSSATVMNSSLLSSTTSGQVAVPNHRNVSTASISTATNKVLFENNFLPTARPSNNHYRENRRQDSPQREFVMQDEDESTEIDTHHNSPSHRRDQRNQHSPSEFGNHRGDQSRGHGLLPWTSPTSRSSPADQLIAAVLDGDVQAIRSVVHAAGMPNNRHRTNADSEDLKSEFWSDLCRSTLPVHRAISGLHFHGSEDLLVATIETLAALGADFTAVDHTGNSVLHKAIHVCSSKSVLAVVTSLLDCGANPNVVNAEGDSVLHCECRR